MKNYRIVIQANNQTEVNSLVDQIITTGIQIDTKSPSRVLGNKWAIWGAGADNLADILTALSGVVSVIHSNQS